MELVMTNYLIIFFLIYFAVLACFATYFNTIDLINKFSFSFKIKMPEISEEKLKEKIEEWNNVRLNVVWSLPKDCEIIPVRNSGEDYYWKMLNSTFHNRIENSFGIGGRIIERENNVIKKISLDEVSLLKNEQWKREYLREPVFTDKELEELDKKRKEESEGKKEVREYRNRINQKEKRDE